MLQYERGRLRSALPLLLPSPGPPSTPDSLQVSSFQPQRLHVAWAPVPALPGEAVNYRVEIIDLKTNTPLFSEVTNSSFVFSPGDSSGTACDEYRFRVQAVNSAGYSEFSNPERKALPQCEMHSCTKSCVFSCLLVGLMSLTLAVSNVA